MDRAESAPYAHAWSLCSEPLDHTTADRLGDLPANYNVMADFRYRLGVCSMGLYFLHMESRGMCWIGQRLEIICGACNHAGHVQG
jgi:hypothetical protein